MVEVEVVRRAACGWFAFLRAAPLELVICNPKTYVTRRYKIQLGASITRFTPHFSCFRGRWVVGQIQDTPSLGQNDARHYLGLIRARRKQDALELPIIQCLGNIAVQAAEYTLLLSWKVA